jgi:predicted nucleotidyltransferase
LESIEGALHHFFSGQQEILLAYLFGSYLEREKRPYHDIDVAVFLLPPRIEVLNKTTPYGYRAQLVSQLCHLLKYNQVDVVLLNDASPVLLRQVIAKGKLIFRRSDIDRIDFEVKSLKRYADTARIRAIKRLYMKQRIERGLAAYAGSRDH